MKIIFFLFDVKSVKTKENLIEICVHRLISFRIINFYEIKVYRISFESLNQVN